MYRIFCESYYNFKNTFNDDNYRLKIAEPIGLIVDEEKFKNEKKVETDNYKKLCDLINFMKKNINQFPKVKAFLWTLSSRNMKGKNYSISTTEELEEQIKLVNSFLKLAYWY